MSSAAMSSASASSGTVGSGGGDWILVGPDGWGSLDVRLTIDTEDGAHIYVQYFGVVEYNDASNAANAGTRSSDYADHYFRTAPRLESGDPRYAWVNRTLFVGEGSPAPGTRRRVPGVARHLTPCLARARAPGSAQAVAVGLRR